MARADDSDEEDEEDEENSIDELDEEASMRGARNGNNTRQSPLHQRSSPPQVPARFDSFGTPDVPFSEDDLALSIGTTNKSFGMEHEAGMLQSSTRRDFVRSSSQQPTPVPKNFSRSVYQRKLQITTTRPIPDKADKAAIDESIDDLLAEERARLQREGPPRVKVVVPQAAAKPAAVPVTASVRAPPPVPAPIPAPASATRPTPRTEPRRQSPTESHAIPSPQAHNQQQLEPNPEVKSTLQGRVHGQTHIMDTVKNWLRRVEPADGVDQQSEVHEDEPEWPWLPLLKNIFWGVAAITSVLLLSSVFSTAFSDPNRKVGMHTAVSHRIATAWYDMAGWIMPSERRYNETAVLLSWLDGKDAMEEQPIWSRMWNNHKEYVGRFEALGGAIEKMKDELPEHIVARRHPDGRLEIADEFWNALLSKAQSKNNDATWVGFLKANNQKLKSLESTPLDAGKPTARPQIVDREEFVSAMRKHYETVLAEVDHKIIEALRTHETQIKSLIQAEARKTLMDSIRLQSLAQSNLMANYELTLKKPNYFSPGLGAIIEPGRTSSTFDNSSTSLGSWYRGRVRRANPPLAALMKWEEFGDCWCAAPNPMRGYARLGVSVPRRLFPKQVTIEHAPMTMSPTGKINNAPRNIELWAETDQPIKHHYGQSHNKCLDPGDLRGLGYVCLGAFKYNIHASNNVQTFDLDAELTASTSRVVVQVTSNWGAPNTCIYRVRLHGDDAEEKYHYDVTLND